MALRRSLLGMLVLFVAASVAGTEPADAAAKRRRRQPAAATKPRPSPAWLEARAAIVLDSRTGQTLFERDGDRRMYPASTTKVLTAILAIESGRLDEKVVIQRSDLQVQPSILGLVAGERITLRDLVYGLMLRSGNDAGLAIARHVGGTRANFYAMMNAKAEALGCTGSHFTNPHGLPDREHYTTARDLGLIMMAALKNEEFRTVTGTQRYVSMSSQAERVFLNKNRLLKMYPGATGGKPGYTRAAQQTLVASAMRRDRELVVVCLHSIGRALWTDATHLLDLGFDRLGFAGGGSEASVARARAAP